MRTLNRLVSMAVGAAIASATPAHAAPDEKRADGLTDKQVASLLVLDECVNGAIKIFYTQTEPATVVATAALATCAAEVIEVKKAYGLGTIQAAEDATRPHVIAQVMTLRAIAAAAPTQNSTTPAKKEYMQ